MGGIIEEHKKALVKETLNIHPPTSLLSWACLSTDGIQLSNGMVIPLGAATMVSMWPITHVAKIWAWLEEFMPERFMVAKGY
ncbi:putative Cytochrome P450 78A11 [Cocos nucifera]|nr:putative Cytochrome P450 78A11 [Cocos nucifera]